jgi:hypothetical protein
MADATVPFGSLEGEDTLAMLTPTRNQDWLALTVEPPLDPRLPICVPHQRWDRQYRLASGS